MAARLEVARWEHQGCAIDASVTWKHVAARPWRPATLVIASSDVRPEWVMVTELSIAGVDVVSAPHSAGLFAPGLGHLPDVRVGVGELVIVTLHNRGGTASDLYGVMTGPLDPEDDPC